MIGGKLKLKGKFQRTKERIEQKVRDILEEEENGRRDNEFVTDLKQNHNPDNRERIIFSKPLQDGSGTIMTSGKTVHGQNTDFPKLLEPGDYLSITNGNNEVETKQIITIFSARSMMIETPFLHDLITFIPFRYRKKPTTKELQTVEEQVQDTFEVITKKIKKPSTTLEYRTKIGMWAYKTMKDKIDGDLTREEILQLRSKKNRDKHCWC